MGTERKSSPAYVIKARELTTLYFLDVSHPRPCELEWINRGTNQKLRPTTVDMLLRTLHQPSDRPSVQALHETSGLKASFRTARERQRFARAFEAARRDKGKKKAHLLAALFPSKEKAEGAVYELEDLGVPREALSMIWRTSELLDPDYAFVEGHSAGSIAGITASAGVGGALFGVAVLLIPGVGEVAAAGAILASIGPSVAAIGGVIGATGGAIARMLTDHDVDGPSAKFFEKEIRRGKAFLSVDARKTDVTSDSVENVFARNGGKVFDAD